MEEYFGWVLRLSDFDLFQNNYCGPFWKFGELHKRLNKCGKLNAVHIFGWQYSFSFLGKGTWSINFRGLDLENGIYISLDRNNHFSIDIVSYSYADKPLWICKVAEVLTKGKTLEPKLVTEIEWRNMTEQIT